MFHSSSTNKRDATDSPAVFSAVILRNKHVTVIAAEAEGRKLKTHATDKSVLRDHDRYVL